MQLICTLITGVALICGGIVDYKKREIPNLVPVVLLATGLFFDRNILWRLLLMLSVAAILWLTGKITKQPLPGGDFKLLCTLAFSSGLLPLLGTLFCVAFGAVFMSLTKRLPVKRNIPLCTYAAPAYFVTIAALFI